MIETVPDVVSNSYAGREFLVEKFDLAIDRVKILNNGIQCPKNLNRTKWRQKLKLSDSDVLVVMVANLTKYKDHETLIGAFSKLHKNCLDRKIHLLLVGRFGETAELIKSLAFDSQLCGQVHFAGEVEMVTDCYAAADIAVHSSTHEGCPNAVLEAMAHGLPVCGTDISGIRQALGDDYPRELLAPKRNAAALHQCLLRLVESNEMRQMLGERNQKRIGSHYSPEVLLESVLTLIHQHVNT